MEAYFDNSATTPVYPEVRDLVVKLMEEDYGNPSSLHQKGVDAARYVSDARDKIARLLKVQAKEIVFTSGGTESNNMALIGGTLANRRAGNKIITTAVEHASVGSPLTFLEDMGFVCADNMPCQLAKQYIELCSSSENNIERVALVIDSRESVFGYNPLNTYDELRRLECPYEIMFLECEDSVLVRRYSETRRRHPMNDDVGIGIQTEREILIPLKEKANYIVDTTNMRLNELRKTVEDILMRGKNIPLRLIISSFGFKRGIPKNADFIFDMRYTANPFYIEELRCKSGRDEEVRRFIFSDANVRRQLNMIENMLDLVIPEFIKQGKRRLMVAFGCTGGRHRSVAMAEALHDRMKDKCSVLLEHRDLVSEADDIRTRFEPK